MDPASAVVQGRGGDAPGQPPGSKREILFVVFTTILIDFIAFSVLIPVLPLYAERLGATPGEVGLVLAVHALAQLLFLPAWGWVSDRVGRRPVILVSLFGTVGAFGAMAAADTILWIYAARALSGFFAASVGTAQAVVTDVTSEDERAGGMGLIGASVGLGMVLGPVLGGLLATVDEKAPFYAVALLAAGNFALAWVRLPETRPAEANGPPRWRELWILLVPAPLRLVAAVHDARIALYLVVFLLVFTALGVLESMTPLLLSMRFGTAELGVSFIFAWFGTVFVFTQGVVLRPLVSRLGEPALVRVGLLGMALGIGAVGVAPNEGSFYAIVTLVGAGMGAAFPAFTSMFTRACESEQAGELLAESQAMAMTGRMIGPWTAGLAMERFVPETPFWVAAVLVFSALVLIAVARRKMIAGVA
jgi:MFS family permease